MTTFRKVLTQLASEKNYSWRWDGVDPTTREEYDASIVWHSVNEKITWDEVYAELYKEMRRLEYPLIGDQLDALWKGGDAASEMLQLINEVKNKYPKA